VADALAPGGLLAAIVERKRRDIADRLGAITLTELRDRARRTRRSLRAALAQPGARFIMEVKRASPSAGAPGRAVDAEVQARAYRAAADAVSVLTDGPFFAGSLDDLAAARRGFDGPILAKDFIVDLRQVAEARLHGADAVLAILSVLGPQRTGEVIDEARRFGMDVLVEAHTEREVRDAVGIGAPIIGINNRNLATLEIDLAVTERLAPLVPADRLLVSESGIRSRADAERLASHADAFLVGSSLMAAPDPALAARALAFGRVKICGLTNVDDVRAAAAAGASYAGIVMVPGTPRDLCRRDAVAVVEAAREAGLRTVGVFRDAPTSDVAFTARALGLEIVQLHGGEDRRSIGALRTLLRDGVEIWGASAVGSSRPGLRDGADRTLFDTRVDGHSGGTGRTFDWALLRGVAGLDRSILAGGLNPGNARAAARIGAFALDVGSGVEGKRRRRKNHKRMRAFFEVLRLSSRQETRRCA